VEMAKDSRELTEGRRTGTEPTVAKEEDLERGFMARLLPRSCSKLSHTRTTVIAANVDWIMSYAGEF